jgi:hypothetical protein
LSDKLVERLRSRRKWDSARGMERAESPFPYLEEEAADRIEALEQALREAASQRLLYAAEHWCMEECRICTLNRQIADLLTPSAAPEPQ